MASRRQVGRRRENVHVETIILDRQIRRGVCNAKVHRILRRNRGSGVRIRITSHANRVEYNPITVSGCDADTDGRVPCSAVCVDVVNEIVGNQVVCRICSVRNRGQNTYRRERPLFDHVVNYVSCYRVSRTGKRRRSWSRS